ncbi:hypothetical protein RJ639_019941 [Escallonia herrerae]|uniref:Signal peptidase complex catalytic subunit SEC11 n=2 Tax=Escallonia herrerae TaxID=1293975 RepID=A0AA89AJ13_9ASTE|nr:hypothetical protein RJ639_019941 [Escallonia herrerae]
MEISAKSVEYVRSVMFRRITTQAINLGVIITHALMLWKLWICLSGSGSPVVVVLTGSMEPGFRKGDVLFLYLNDSPIRSGEIVVFQVEGRDIPIVHRAIMVHQRRNGDEFNILTKGDNNSVDDRHGIYADGQLWLERNHIIGRVMGYLPYVGWATIIMTENPVIKRETVDWREKVLSRQDRERPGVRFFTLDH